MDSDKISGDRKHWGKTGLGGGLCGGGFRYPAFHASLGCPGEVNQAVELRYKENLKEKSSRRGDV